MSEAVHQTVSTRRPETSGSVVGTGRFRSCRASGPRPNRPPFLSKEALARGGSMLHAPKGYAGPSELDIQRLVDPLTAVLAASGDPMTTLARILAALASQVAAVNAEALGYIAKLTPQGD